MFASEIGGSADERHASLRAEAAGVRLDASCYNLPISQLRLEGREDEAAATVEQMARAACPPMTARRGSARTTTSHGCDRGVRRLLHLAHRAGVGALDGLMARGLADHRHMETMADGACADLEERQALRKLSPTSATSSIAVARSRKEQTTTDPF